MINCIACRNFISVFDGATLVGRIIKTLSGCVYVPKFGNWRSDEFEFYPTVSQCKEHNIYLPFYDKIIQQQNPTYYAKL